MPGANCAVVSAAAAAEPSVGEHDHVGSCRPTRSGNWKRLPTAAEALLPPPRRRKRDSRRNRVGIADSPESTSGCDRRRRPAGSPHRSGTRRVPRPTQRASRAAGNCDGLVAPTATDAYLEGKDARGIAHKVVAGQDGPAQTLVFAGQPPEDGVWEPQSVRLVAAAKALSGSASVISTSPTRSIRRTA